MVKKVHLFSLAKGNDPDKVWSYWVDEHAANIKKVPGVRKYVINRVTKVEMGDPRLWGLVEIWFDSEEAYHKSMNMEHPPDDFHSMTSEPRFSAWMEEKIVV